MKYRLALFGHPVKHSLSPKIHQEFADQFDLNIDYQLIDVKTEQLHQKLKRFFAEGGHGANITVPHKQSIMTFAEQITPLAQQAGAANTLYLQSNKIWADNTDGQGLLRDFTAKNITLNNRRILIIGAGGAVQGIIPNLLKSAPKSIHLYNRTWEKAHQLSTVSPLCHVLGQPHDTTAFDVIINGTSLGHQGKSPPLHSTWIHRETIAYDLSYADAARPFLTAAKDNQVSQAYDGLGMLYQQAALAFALWFNKQPIVNETNF